MALIKCWECGKQISDTAASCPSCGAAKKTNPDAEVDAAIQRVARSLMDAGTMSCPACGGRMTKMDAGDRGSAFGSGSLLGAFTKQYRCGACGHLA
tara:strand:- start:209 stop:496 length:288 start_codon:yes stop_codon:yes gene_type:complete